ncbi:MAG: DUF2017 family protein [Propionibacterium sp.]|nr:DUF2017 family protein [Propionibacterium sp.]
MNLRPDDIVWLFDGRGGMQRVLADLVGGLMVSVQQLMPPSALHTFDDPFSAMAADSTFNARDEVTGVRLSRLFPRHLTPEHDREGQEWEGLVRARSVATHSNAGAVLADIEESGAVVPVRESKVNAWLQTLGSLRAVWHADLVGSDAPNAVATPKQLDENPTLATLLDWLAYMIEDLLATRDACVRAGTGIDITEFEDWE